MSTNKRRNRRNNWSDEECKEIFEECYLQEEAKQHTHLSGGENNCLQGLRATRAYELTCTSAERNITFMIRTYIRSVVDQSSSNWACNLHIFFIYVAQDRFNRFVIQITYYRLFIFGHKSEFCGKNIKIAYFQAFCEFQIYTSTSELQKCCASL